MADQDKLVDVPDMGVVSFPGSMADDLLLLKGMSMKTSARNQFLGKVVAIRKQDHAERQEQEAILDLYLNALGIV